LAGEFPGGGPHTLFWRHQPLGPACLSTAEATYYALRGLEIARKRRESGEGTEGRVGGGLGESLSKDKEDCISRFYDGRFDDLLLFFLSQYHKIQRAYTSEEVGGIGGKKRSFTSKMRKGYIKDAQPGDKNEQQIGEGGECVTHNPSSNEAKRKKVKLKGGWAVRMDDLDDAAAAVKARAQARFAEHTAAGSSVGNGDIFFDVCAGLKHEYAVAGKLLDAKKK